MSKSNTAPRQQNSPAKRYLQFIGRRIKTIRKDIPDLIEVGQRMSEPLLKGGRLFIPPVAKFWPSEFGGRAGGFMALKRMRLDKPSKKDLAYIALPMPGQWCPDADQTFQKLLKSNTHIFVNGREDELNGTRGITGFTGGAKADEGLYALDRFKPLSTVRPFDQFVRGWMTAGELMAACIRNGKMPTIYMSVWLEGSMARNSSFIVRDNLREPWPMPFFHKDYYVPPLDPGYAAHSFLDIAADHHQTLTGQLSVLAKAGQWMADAKKSGKRIWAVATGHSYPGILELPEDGSYPIEWGHSISDIRKALPRNLKPGDVVMHLGYAPVDVPAVERILKKGIRLIHTSPYGRPATLQDHKNLAWLDLPWRPGDASVDVPGYGARILPMSSTCHTMAYFAILAEMAERMGWK